MALEEPSASTLLRCNRTSREVTKVSFWTSWMFDLVILEPFETCQRYPITSYYIQFCCIGARIRSWLCLYHSYTFALCHLASPAQGDRRWENTPLFDEKSSTSAALWCLVALKVALSYAYDWSLALAGKQTNGCIPTQGCETWQKQSFQGPQLLATFLFACKLPWLTHVQFHLVS